MRTGRAGLFLGLFGDCEDRGRAWSLSWTVRMGAEPGLFLGKLGSVRTGAEPGLFLGYLDDCEDRGRAWSLSGIVGGL